jgi:transcriptional regulator GlxA family with amidase domain
MAKGILAKQPVFFTPAEFQHCRRLAKVVNAKAQNLERIFQAAGRRSAAEFRQSMKIIQGRDVPGEEGGEA